MKILVVGGYGFIGSAIAEKLIQEKYKVTIIDNLSTGNKKNVRLNHKSIDLNATNRRCKKIFEEDKFDAIVYAARRTALNDDLINFHEKAENIVGLRHMLELSLKYEVNRFIFLSSYEVYGTAEQGINESSPLNPISDEGREYQYQESFCRDYIKKGLNVNILRLSNVYGPRLTKESLNFINLACHHNKQNQLIKLKRHSNSFQDYIFVNDVADAVSKTINNVAPLILNIASNHKTLNSDIVNYCNDHLKKSEREAEAINLDNYVQRPFYVLSNTLAYQTIGWSPQTDLNRGLTTTTKWYDSFELKEDEKEKVAFWEEDNSKTLGQKVQPFLENIAVFAAFAVLKLFLAQVLQINVDVMMIYILLIAVFYGLNQGVVAAILASLFYVSTEIRAGVDISYAIFDLHNIFNLLIYILAGSITGYAIDKERYNFRLLEWDYKDVTSELKFVLGVYDKSIEVKNALQNDIEHYEDSFGKVFDITSKLNKVNTEEVFIQSVKVVSEILKAKSVSIIHLDTSGDYGRVMASLGKNKFGNSIKIAEHNYLEEVISQNKIFMNKELDAAKPVLVAPIAYNNRVVALLLIDDVEFDNLSIRYINMLKVVSLLISNSIGTASIYQEAIEAKKYIGKTQILKTEWFKEVLDIKKQAEQDELSTWYLFTLNMSVKQGITQHEKLLKVVRSSDYIGETEDNRVAILFSNAQDTDRKSLHNRLIEQGFKIYEEE